MQRLKVAAALKSGSLGDGIEGREIEVRGWVRTKRESKQGFAFVELNDGSCMANLQMASSLKFMGYDYKLVYGEGAHNSKQAGAILPDALRWLWRDTK